MYPNVSTPSKDVANLMKNLNDVLTTMSTGAIPADGEVSAIPGDDSALRAGSRASSAGMMKTLHHPSVYNR